MGVIRGLAGTLMPEALVGSAGAFVTVSTFGEQAPAEAQLLGLTLVDGRDLLDRATLPAAGLLRHVMYGPSPDLTVRTVLKHQHENMLDPILDAHTRPRLTASVVAGERNQESLAKTRVTRCEDSFPT